MRKRGLRRAMWVLKGLCALRNLVFNVPAGCWEGLPIRGACLQGVMISGYPKEEISFRTHWGKGSLERRLEGSKVFGVDSAPLADCNGGRIAVRRRQGRMIGGL